MQTPRLEGGLRVKIYESIGYLNAMYKYLSLQAVGVGSTLKKRGRAARLALSALVVAKSGPTADFEVFCSRLSPSNRSVFRKLVSLSEAVASANALSYPKCWLLSLLLAIQSSIRR